MKWLSTILIFGVVLVASENADGKFFFFLSMEVSFCMKNIKVLWTFLIHDFIRKTYPKLLPYI